MRHALLAIAALMLAACQPQGPDGKRAEAPADAPAPPPEPPPPPEEPKEFVGDIDARGTEPFWSLEIRANALTLKRPDPDKDVSAANPGAVDDGSQAVWSTVTADGKAFIVTLVMDGVCSDGMSDLTYPYVAVVTYGDLTYRGCAYKMSNRPTGAN